MSFVALAVVAWVLCGAREIYAQHMWWHRDWDNPIMREFITSPDWFDRSAFEAYAFGPIAMYIGYRYRRFHDHRR